jgi:hypothetical protein
MLINSLAKLSRSSRNAASASLIVIAALAMYNWIVAPHTTYLTAAQQHEVVVATVARKNEHITKMVELKRKKLEKLREQSAHLLSTIFTADKATEFFSDLQAISEQSGCTVHSLSFVSNTSELKSGHLEDSTGVADKSAVLSVIGGYSDIIKLFERLQMRSEKVWIDSVRMQTVDRRSANPRCDITLRIHTIPNKESTL